jgi:hypothetical protein
MYAYTQRTLFSAMLDAYNKSEFAAQRHSGTNA